MKSKLAAQKWLWWSDNGKIFYNNILGGFLCRFPVGGGNTNFPEMLLLKFLPLSDHHSHFWVTTFDFTTFFMQPFLQGPHLFLQFGCFCVDIYVGDMSLVVNSSILQFDDDVKIFRTIKPFNDFSQLQQDLNSLAE